MGYSKIEYVPCTNWGKSSRVICGERQYVLEEVSGWTSNGKFQELAGQATLDQALRRTQECQFQREDGTPFSWPSTIKEAGVGMEETLVIDSDEGIERALGILGSGFWVQIEEDAERLTGEGTNINLGGVEAPGRIEELEDEDEHRVGDEVVQPVEYEITMGMQSHHSGLSTSQQDSGSPIRHGRH